MGTVLREARRNVQLLTVAQALLGVVGPISFAVGGVAGHQLLGEDKSLATAPLTAYNLGMALGVVLVAVLSRLVGRRFAFIAGASIAALGGVLATAALFRESFWFFACGLAVLGASNGFTQKLRFAAADASPSFYKAKAISWILGGGIVSAILGPQIVIFAGDYFAPVWFAGAFVALVPVCIVALFFFVLLRLPDHTTASAHHEQPLRASAARDCGQPAFHDGNDLRDFQLCPDDLHDDGRARRHGCRLRFSSDLATLGINGMCLRCSLRVSSRVG